MIAQMDAQDKNLEHLVEKLDAPILNGGFEELSQKVSKIEFITEAVQTAQVENSTKITEIHSVIYDPEKGIYVTMKNHGKWIEAVSKGSKWIVALLITGLVTGVGKLLYDLVAAHIHLMP